MGTSKLIDEYVASLGWSSIQFVEHAKRLFSDRGIRATLDIHRTVLYFRVQGYTVLKAYVHRGGRTANYLTFTDIGGSELASFHYTAKYEEIKRFIADYLSANS